jgi:hypothetical protein
MLYMAEASIETTGYVTFYAHVLASFSFLPWETMFKYVFFAVASRQETG